MLQRKSRREYSLKTLWKGCYKVTLLSKSGLLKSESCWMTMTIPLILQISSSVAQASVHSPIMDPMPVALLEFSIPHSRTLQREMLKAWSVRSLCPSWTIYGETISTIAEHSLPHETRSREWDCHLNSTTAKSPPWKTKGWLNIIWKLKWDFIGNIIYEMGRFRLQC